MAEKTEYVVVHDAVSYRHPESNPAPGQAHEATSALRGQCIPSEESDDPFGLPHISEKEAKRLVAFGAITADKKSLAARLALAGTQRDTRQSGPYASLTSPAEQRQAAIAIQDSAGGSGPQSSRSQLSALAIGDLQRLGQAFGAPEDVYTSDNPEDIIDFLKGEDDEVEDARKTRDASQAAAIELPGHGGPDIAAEAILEDETKPRRKSAAAEAEDGVDATPAARELAASEGIDLSSVKGSGDGGRITKDDVAAAADNR